MTVQEVALTIANVELVDEDRVKLLDAVEGWSWEQWQDAEHAAWLSIGGAYLPAEWSAEETDWAVAGELVVLVLDGAL